MDKFNYYIYAHIIYRFNIVLFFLNLTLLQLKLNFSMQCSYITRSHRY